MQNWLRQVALCFAAGSVGALAKNGAVWCGARLTASTALASHLARAQYPSGLYARIVWGGVAAMLFLLPLARNSWVARGLLWGVVVAALQVVVAPLLEHGSVRLALVPLLSVLVLNCVWGLATVLSLRSFGT